MTSIDLSSIAAELAVIADAVDRYGQRVTDLVQGELPRLDPEGRHDDLLSALHEAERSLRVSHRGLTRSQRLASQ
ncbi:MAG: hypothetical protein ACKOI2_13435 [Actinomycetota bacterium]